MKVVKLPLYRLLLSFRPCEYLGLIKGRDEALSVAEKLHGTTEESIEGVSRYSVDELVLKRI